MRSDRARSDEQLLGEGSLEVEGRILPASNLTVVGDVTGADRSLRCVYKPISGERPLWDFPDGTLAAREVAAYVVSQALGWDVVPLTLLRDGPLGVGMVQQWQEPDPGQEPVDLVAERTVPPGYRHVLDALDGEGRAVSLVHEDSLALRRMAVFDALVNNADRKGGHVLPMADGHRYGVDHGVCFNAEPKLRTVLWGWAGEPLAPEDRAAVQSFLDGLRAGDELCDRLEQLLAPSEVAALLARTESLLTSGRMPLPSTDWPAIPWPAF